MENTTIRIFGKPQGKGRPRFFRGHAVTPKTTREYEKRVKQIYGDGICYHVSVPLKVVIKAYYPIPKSTTKRVRHKIEDGELLPTKKPDADNVAKIIMDALNGVAYDDDAQVVDLVVQKRFVDTNCAEAEQDGYVDVTISAFKWDSEVETD